MNAFDEGICYTCHQSITQLFEVTGYTFCSDACRKEFAYDLLLFFWKKLVDTRDLMSRHIGNFPDGNGLNFEKCQQILSEIRESLDALPPRTNSSADHSDNL